MQGLITSALNLLPASPLTLSGSQLAPLVAVMGQANYWFPIGAMADEAAVVATAVLAWFVVRIALRFVDVAAK